jgi:hypothetical protein
LAVLACLAIASQGGAQSGNAAQAMRIRAVLTGRVLDQVGRPVPYAYVSAEDDGPMTLTSDSGEFRLALADAGLAVFAVRRVGYTPVFFQAMMPADSSMHVQVTLTQVVRRLTEVTVEEKMRSMSLARSGFYERQNEGWGAFILPAEIDARKPSDIVDMLRQVNGVRIEVSGMRSLAFGADGGGFCVLNVYLDGSRYRLGPEGLRAIPPSTVRAIEVYPRAASTPMRFTNTNREQVCGALVLWTKVD